MTYLSFSDAMQIVSEYGRNKDADSLFDAIAIMEDNRYNLTALETLAMDTVIGEYERMAYAFNS